MNSKAAVKSLQEYVKDTETIELYFQQGSSDKVYHLQLEGVEEQWSVHAQWGRRGSALQPSRLQARLRLDARAALAGRGRCWHRGNVQLPMRNRNA
jgi:hypothetical protein